MEIGRIGFVWRDPENGCIEFEIETSDRSDGKVLRLAVVAPSRQRLGSDENLALAIAAKRDRRRALIR